MKTNFESCKKCAIKLAQISKDTLVMYPMSVYKRDKNMVKLMNMLSFIYIFFNEEDKVDHIIFKTITEPYVMVSKLQSDNPEVVDCSDIMEGVE